MKSNNGFRKQGIAGLALLGSILPLIGADGPAAPATGHGSPPPMRNIPGITAPDQFPAGCVDCHVYQPEMNLDVRISALMSGWTDEIGAPFTGRMQTLMPEGSKLQGRHPALADAAWQDIPAACIKCHAQSSTRAPSFGQMMHVIHLGGLRDGHFLSIFQGECTHCHKLEMNTGAWRVPSGPERAKAPKGTEDETSVKKPTPASSRTAAGESLYTFCFIMSGGIATFLFLGMIVVRAVTESPAAKTNQAEH